MDSVRFSLRYVVLHIVSRAVVLEGPSLNLSLDARSGESDGGRHPVFRNQVATAPSEFAPHVSYDSFE